MARGWRFGLVAGVTTLVSLSVPGGIRPTFAARPPHDADVERTILADFIYTTAKYVQWPPEAFTDGETPLTFGVLGDDDLAGTLEGVVAGKRILGRPVSVKRLADAGDFEACHVLFVAETPGTTAPDILDAVGDNRILTVSDLSNFARIGGAVGLKIVENMVRFEVNTDALKRAGLEIRPTFMALGRKVTDSRR